MKLLLPLVAAAMALPALGRDSVVVFNEVHYHPSGDDGALEYVEFYNQLAANVDLSNWRIEGAIRFDFPEGTVIRGREYLVVAKNPSALAAATGHAGALGPFEGALSNSGASVYLYNNNRSFRTAPQANPGVPSAKLWSVDFQGDGAGGAFGQLVPPVTMSGNEGNAGLGNIWNAFVLPGHSGTVTDPSLALKDSAGAVSPVTFSITGRVTGWSQSGSALISDYLFVNAGNSAATITWKLSGLTPGETYVLFPYGAISRDIRLTVDKNGDGNLADETSFIAAAAGILVKDITASGAGEIIGRAERGSVVEGNWSGFQVFEQAATANPPVGTATASLDRRRIMDRIDYADTYPWPVGPDGTGFTLAKRDPATGTEWPASWTTGGQRNGTPGAANTFPPLPSIAFNEASATTDPAFRIEIHNYGSTPVVLDGMVIGSSNPLHADYTLANGSLAGGAFLTVNAATLGFVPANNNRLLLFTAGKTALIDALRADNRATARRPDGTGRWLRPDAPTFGAPNSFALEERIVINEIFYHAYPQRASNVPPGQPFAERAEEWLELYNRSAAAVDLTGWKLEGGIGYRFPAGTSLPPGAYLVIAKNAAALAAKHPSASILGDYSRSLGNGGDFLVLEDPQGNPADEVHYFDSGKWHSAADGAGSSLELRDFDADNGNPGAWTTSDETARSPWKSYTYEGVAINDGIGNNVYHEFLLGLLDAGEFLLDDVSVVEDNSVQFIQNGSFQGDTIGAAANKWRVLGTHGSHGRTKVVADPDDPGNRCLHVVATGATEDKHNKLETTYANSEQVVPGRSYRISFRAKWLSGSNQVNTRLYFNYLQRTTLLDVPDTWGTPGLPNSRAVSNAGPTLEGLSHSPVVPGAGQAVTVSVKAADPDGIGTLTLFYSVNGGSVQSLPMAVTPDGAYVASIPGQSAGAILRFHVRGRDTSNVESFLPAAGASGGAFYKVQDGFADNSGIRHNFRIVMAESDRAFLFLNTNRMSNDNFQVTVIEDEKTAYYDVGLRLKASGFGRFNSGHYGFNIEFQPDRLFRGVHSSISVERSPNLKEILAKHLMNRAGGGYWSFYDDVAYVIPPTTGDRGVGLLSMSRQTSSFFDDLFPDAAESGTLFNQELLYNPNGTTGGPEGLKIGNPYNHTNGMYDLADRGADKEPYRWGFQIRSARDRDDYSRLIALNRALALNGEALRIALEELIDVDQWMRTFAMMSLNGTDDVYSRLYEHNFRYFVRPTDQKIIVFQWDLDRSFQLASTEAVAPTRNSVAKLFSIPPFRRLFDGHLNDLIQTTFNTTYTTPWASHFTTLTGSGLTGLPGYISSRASFVGSSLPSPVAFVITTNNGGAFSIEDTHVDLAGDAGIDVFSITVNGVSYPLTWTDGDSWRITVPLHMGMNPLVFTAFNNRGTEIGSDTITVTGTSARELAHAGNTIVSELHYHPAIATPTEIAAGFNNAELFEFIELTNTGPVPIDFTGVRFTHGILYDFPAGTMLNPGARLVIGSNRDAFAFRYAAASLLGVYTGNLRNSGERVRVQAADTSPIADFTYGDAHPWPESADGDGYSLVFAGNDPASPLSWRPSTQIGGNPATGDSMPFAGTSADLIPYALASAPVASFSAETFALSFRRNLPADAAVVTVEFSRDMATWTPASVEHFVSGVNEGDGTLTVTYRSPLAPGDEPRQFGRVRVDLR